MSPITFNVINKDEFYAIITKIKKNNPSKTIFFRGQVSDRPLIPSTKRQILNGYEKFRNNVQSIVWEQIIHNILREISDIHSLEKRSDFLILGMALLQHYGYKSWFIDVTDNPLIALWFASHQYQEENFYFKGVSCEQCKSDTLIYTADLAYAILKKSYYIQNDRTEGFVYLLGIENSDLNLLLDLRQIVPKNVAPRIHQQDASGLLEPNDGRDLNSLIEAKLVIKSSIFSELNDFTIHDLFPPPSIDEVYKKTISIPCILRYKNINHGNYSAYPQLDVPIYLDESQIIPELKGNIKIVALDGLFPYLWNSPQQIINPEDGKHVIGGQHFKFLDTNCIKLPISDADGYSSEFLPENINNSDIIHDIAQIHDEKYIFEFPLLKENLDFKSIWPSNNLFLENSLFLTINSIGFPDEHVIRGFWVVYTENEIYIKQVFDDFRFFGFKLGCHYKYSDGIWKIIRKVGDCQLDDDTIHLSLLVVFLFWSDYIRRKEVKLEKIFSKMYHINWPHQLIVK